MSVAEEYGHEPPACEFDDWDDAELIRHLRGRVLLLESGLTQAHRLIDRSIITLREHGLHADADDIERLAAPF